MHSEYPQRHSHSMAEQREVPNKPIAPGHAEVSTLFCTAEYDEYSNQVTVLRSAREDGTLSKVSYTEALNSLQELYSITTLVQALEIMGEENVLGPEEVEKTFSVTITDIPPILFSKKELENANKLNQILLLRINTAADGEPLSMQKIQEIIEVKFTAAGKGDLVFSQEWYQEEMLFTTESPTFTWALISREVLLDSTNKNYLQQTEVLIEYITHKVFNGLDLPLQYQIAIEEFKEQKIEIDNLIESNWQLASQKLVNLTITNLTRKSAVETIYDLALTFDTQNIRLLESKRSWTKSRSSNGNLVFVGRFSAFGARVLSWGNDPDGGLGASFSRSL